MKIDKNSLTKISLSEFVEKNDKLLATVGVLSSVVLLVNVLPISQLAQTLSFLFLFLTILVSLELWRKFPKNGSELLAWFEIGLTGGVMLLAFYWFLEYRTYLPQVLPLLIFLVLVKVTSYYIKKNDLFNRIFHKKQTEGKRLRYLFALLLYFLAIVLSVIITKPLQSFLNSIYKSLLR